MGIPGQESNLRVSRSETLPGIELKTTRKVWAHNLSCDHSSSKGLTQGTLLIFVLIWPELSHNNPRIKKCSEF